MIGVKKKKKGRKPRFLVSFPTNPAVNTRASYRIPKDDTYFVKTGGPNHTNFMRLLSQTELKRIKQDALSAFDAQRLQRNGHVMLPEAGLLMSALWETPVPEKQTALSAGTNCQ